MNRRIEQNGCDKYKQSNLQGMLYRGFEDSVLIAVAVLILAKAVNIELLLIFMSHSDNDIDSDADNNRHDRLDRENFNYY